MKLKTIAVSTTSMQNLPLTETVSPRSYGDVATIVANAYRDETSLYPIGGGTSLNFGCQPQTEGIGLSLANLADVIDYPARDMTITVQAGVTMRQLTDTLAQENQRLPIDVPLPEQATIGGVVATNFSGPRRFGLGTVRDYVIGIRAVDGRGVPFKGGGRVVKNVAGYDFCKLLTGSLGALGVITEVTLKIVPIPQQSRLITGSFRTYEQAEKILAALTTSQVPAVAVELLTGPAWTEEACWGPLPTGSLGRIVVGIEGSAAEVQWMQSTLLEEWKTGPETIHVATEQVANDGWDALAAFPQDDEAPLVIKASLLPEKTTQYVQLCMELDPQCAIEAHAGNGIVVAKFKNFSASDVSPILIGKLQPAASLGGGSVCVLSCGCDGNLTHQAVWGYLSRGAQLMRSVKDKFDPLGILTPGRVAF